MQENRDEHREQEFLAHRWTGRRDVIAASVLGLVLAAGAIAFLVIGIAVL